MSTTLTPILTKFWDDPQSWTLETYERNGGYQALKKALGMKPADLVQPGHIFPLRARRGGVLERSGQTEAAERLTGLLEGKAGLPGCATVQRDARLRAVVLGDGERDALEHRDVAHAASGSGACAPPS